MDTMYSELALRHQEAYRTFLRIYQSERPKPKTPRWWENLPWVMLPFAIVAIAGITLSATRTGVVFFDIAARQFQAANILTVIEAITAIIAIDLFIVVSRYVVILIDYRQNGEERHADKWVNFGFWVAFGIALAANVYSSVKDVAVIADIRPGVDLAIGLAVGLSAPLLAFISGDILGILWVNSEKRRTEAKQAFQQTLDDYLQAREKSWNAQKKHYGVSIQDIVDIAPVQSRRLMSVDRTDTDGQHHATGQGYNKRMDAKDIVRQHLEANPEDFEISVRVLADKLNVGKSTVADVRRMMHTHTNGSSSA